MNELNRLREQRGALLASVKEIMSRAKARPEGQNDLTAEEGAQIDKLYAEFDAAGVKLANLERQSTLERAEAQLAEATRRTAPAGAVYQGPNQDYAEGVRAWMLRGHGVTPDQAAHAARVGIDINSVCITIRYNQHGVTAVNNGEAVNGRELPPIRRDLATTSGSSAFVQWREFTSEFDKALQFRGSVLNHVKRIRTASGVTLPIPTVTDVANRGRWLAEAGAVTGTDPTPAHTTLGAFKASSDKVVISIEALQDDQVVMNQLIPELLGERVGGLYNQAATVGAGTTEPRGIMLDSAASGVTIGGTNAAPTYSWDDLLDLKSSVDPAYRMAEGRAFMMSDTVFRKYRKLKDGSSRYFVDPMLPGPGMIDGDPLILNNDVVATGVGAKVACYGDLKRYWWRDVMEVTFYRLDQIAILNGQIVFVAFSRADGRLVNTAAVKHLLNPAS